MAEIIAFPSKIKTNEDFVVGNNVVKAEKSLSDVPTPRNKYEYLQICKEFLEENEYKDILCAIMDVEFYENLDSSYKKVVDSYYGLD